jgi:hypothetical protein
VNLPALCEEPRSWRRFGPWFRFAELREESFAPPIEMLRRRVVVERAHAERDVTMLSEVVDDVPHGRLHFMRALEVVAMVAIVPDLSLSLEHRVEPLGERNDEAAHSRPQGRLSRRTFRARGRHEGPIVSLDDHVHMVRLNREVDDLKRGAIRAATLIAEHAKNERMNELLPEGGQTMTSA